MPSVISRYPVSQKSGPPLTFSLAGANGGGVCPEHDSVVLGHVFLDPKVALMVPLLLANSKKDTCRETETRLDRWCVRSCSGKAQSTSAPVRRTPVAPARLSAVVVVKPASMAALVPSVLPPSRFGSRQNGNHAGRAWMLATHSPRARRVRGPMTSRSPRLQDSESPLTIPLCKRRAQAERGPVILPAELSGPRTHTTLPHKRHMIEH